jgi:hypothetical protein
MTKREAIDLKDLVNKLIQGRTEPEDGWPVIKSGDCDSDALLGWLTGLDLKKLGVRIWCYADACTIGTDAVPKDVELLERARLFGPGGDLEIWRGGKGFRWRYVGPADNAPEGKELPWQGNENDPVFWRERTALLWGNRPESRARWHDNRVAGAALTYPISGAPERVRVRYREYTQAGRPFAVWYTGLEEYDG